MKYAVKVNIDKLKDEALAPFRDEVRNQFERIGEEAVNEARVNHGYTDRTGNLTASIGYVLSSAGGVVSKGGFSGPAEGEVAGEMKATRAATRDDKTRLVVVAGMQYASYVENGHTSKNGRYIPGRPVLANAELLVKQRIERLNNDLNSIVIGK